MNSEKSSEEATKATSSEEVEDKKFVSQAVAFVIGHARNGFVSLCAGVATLLKDQTKLKEDVKNLQLEIAQLKQRIRCSNECVCSGCHGLKSNHIFNKSQSSKSKKSWSIPKTDLLPYIALKGCICHKCSKVKDKPKLNNPLKKGVNVIIVGELCGVVCYVGHVDELEFPEIYVGIQLPEAVGNTDGRLGNKAYFLTAKDCGIFTPLKNVCCIF